MSPADRDRAQAPRCTLEAAGLRAQRERYRQAGAGAVPLERSPRRLALELSEELDRAQLQVLIATERACCPFFQIAWEEAQRTLTFSVTERRHEPALQAIAHALGID